MPSLSGKHVHQATGRGALYEATYSYGPIGVTYRATIRIDGCHPSRVGGVIAWGTKALFARRTIEASLREDVQFIDLDKVLLPGDESHDDS